MDSEDVVNHPSHYNQYEGFEVIDVCEQLRAPDGTGNYNRGNAFKYMARAGWKNPDKHVEDLKKSMFYIQREIERIERGTADLVGDAAKMMTKTKPSVKVDNPTERMCPECSKYLIGLGNDKVCPDNHGVLDIDSWIWSSYETSSVTRGQMTFECPVCSKEMKKTQRINGDMTCFCPDTMHPNLLVLDAKKKEIVQPNFYCPECGAMLADTETSDAKACLNKHGELSTVSWIWRSNELKKYIRAVMIFQCPVCMKNMKTTSKLSDTTCVCPEEQHPHLLVVWAKS